jgi:hypothetical protein
MTVGPQQWGAQTHITAWNNKTTNRHRGQGEGELRESVRDTHRERGTR